MVVLVLVLLAEGGRRGRGHGVTVDLEVLVPFEAKSAVDGFSLCAFPVIVRRPLLCCRVYRRSHRSRSGKLNECYEHRLGTYCMHQGRWLPNAAGVSYRKNIVTG